MADPKPNQGFVNHAPDTWIPLDASFKQYTSVPGLISEDLTAQISASASSFLQSANSDQDGPWVTGFDPAVLNAPIATLQSQIAGILAGNQEKFPLSEVVGGRTVATTSIPVLAASLPYKIALVGARWSTLPASLRVSATITLNYAGAYGEDGSEVLSHTISLPSLGLGSLHLTHVPATSTDAAIWQGYAGAQDFPAYLVNVRAQLSLNGAPLRESTTIGLGRDLVLRVGYSGAGQDQSARFAIVSGDEINIGLDGAGFTPEQGTVLNELPGRDTAAGNLFIANKVFWTQQDFHDRLFGHLHKVAVARLPSAGIFAVPLTIEYTFGIPRRASYRSRQVDVKLSRISALALEGDRGRTVTFVTHSGITASSTEGAVIEQVFSKPIGQGSNTARLLELANQHRIPIYRLTRANLAESAPAVSHSGEVMIDISSAVSAGLEVVIPERQQVNGGWSGSGYIIIDALTGSGDYRVGGGLSGNFSEDLCQRQTQPIRVTVPDVNFIYFMLFGYLIDEDYNFNGVGIAVVLAQITAVAVIAAVSAPYALAGIAVAGRALFATTAIVVSGAALAGEEPEQCDCDAQPVRPRRGGNSPFTARHNICADVWTDEPFQGADIRVAGIHFDGLFAASDTLTEVKTGMFYAGVKSLPNVTPARQRFLDFLLGKSILDFYRERIPAAVCGYDFVFTVRDSAMLTDMQAFFLSAGKVIDASKVINNGCP